MILDTESSPQNLTNDTQYKSSNPTHNQAITKRRVKKSFTFVYS